MIKFYNNSLFKMIKDFVPARADVSTGIIVKPHILERNKYARHEPTMTTSSLLSEISGSKITGSDAAVIKKPTKFVKTEYSTLGLIQVSQSVGFEKFTGEFEGSQFRGSTRTKRQIEYSYQPFQSLSPLAFRTGNYYGSQSISLLALYQNVSSSVKSKLFFHLDYGDAQKNQANNYGLITQSIILGPSYQDSPYSQYAYVQDYNYSARRSVIPRYSGSYSSGYQYNVYTPANAAYSGDVTYGNDPMINYYTNKLGLFTQVETSSFVPGEVNATLAYLVDVSGGLQELNQRNTHWTDVQNTFVAGDTLTIKQFDNKKYGNQKNTDGVKTIFNSGYSYSPELYFVSGVDNSLYFNYAGNSTVSNFIAWNNPSLANNNISGSSAAPSFPVTITNSATRSGSVYNIFSVSNPSNGYTAGVSGQFPTYSAPVAGQYYFTTKFNLTLAFQDPKNKSGNTTDSGSFVYQVIGTNGAILAGSSAQVMSFTSSYTNSGSINATVTASSTVPGSATSITLQSTSVTPLNGPLSYYNGTSSTLYSGSTQIVLGFYSWIVSSNIQYGFLAMNQTGSGFPFTLAGPSATIFTNPYQSQSIDASSTYSNTFTVNYTTPAVSITPSDKISFQLIQRSMSTANYTASISTGPTNSSLALGSIKTGAGGYPYASSSLTTGNFISGAFNDASGVSGSLVLSTDLSNYLGYQFVPYFTSGSATYSSSLFNQYQEVSYVFQPQFGDRIVLYDGVITEYVDVLNYSVDSNNKVNIAVIPTILSNWVSDPTKIKQFLLLRRYNDEQSVRVTFNKKPGQTSYGFLIPSNINPSVLANINSIQAQVQSQLLSTQANSNG